MNDKKITVKQLTVAIIVIVFALCIISVPQYLLGYALALGVAVILFGVAGTVKL